MTWRCARTLMPYALVVACGAALVPLRAQQPAPHVEAIAIRGTAPVEAPPKPTATASLQLREAVIMRTVRGACRAQQAGPSPRVSGS